ncbi:NADP-dependent oxidoreductase [Streptomyces echinatus]|uniref:NADPH:quinone reductase-like Zn-dependent oxidoreductase n=1 Tax=Streptomyces echinatus TaxID=67293 RepID=A0A7W9Q312_9ACTN|nr:NADP-dependent oxidoreductase [Streptomyces echinatus]MBB5932711.1 NADPH:quinone reductase-like Zn-dependent oxidoreductase [Streptomyces echinatus]
MPFTISYDRFGGPDVLTLTETDLPQPAPHQVRVKVKAAGINPLDNKLRRGDLAGVFPTVFPVVPGLDAAGVIDAIGEDVTGFTVGDEVFGVTPGGSYAQYVLMPAPVAKPAALSFETAAALPTVGETAFRALKHLDLTPGETLLIHGSAGSVGAIALQLATARGITVVATAGADDLERVTALGATAVTYGPGWRERVLAAAPQGVDAVFDTSGAGVLGESVDLVGGPDRVITIADMNAAQYGVRLTGLDPADRAPEALPELAALAAAGKLTVEIWRTYPLKEAAQAQDDLDNHRNRGKVILLP